jgi:putative DNA primase/helicase
MADHLDAFRGAVQASLGAFPVDIHPGRFQRFSTNGKPGDKSGWCQLFPDGMAGVFGDFRAGVSEFWSSTRPVDMTPAERAALQRQVSLAKAQREREQRAAWRTNDDRNRFMLRQCRPSVSGDPVHLYLSRRMASESINVPACIQLHPAMPYIHEGETLGVFPCMVAPLVGSDGRMLALHRTYLTADGQKANVPAVRKLTGASRLLAGAAIPLATPTARRLGIAEGIETALAASLSSDVPVVAAYSAGNLAAWRWPREIRALVIFGDNDIAGIKASTELLERAKKTGLDASVLAPSDPGADWCDVYANRGAVSIGGAA